MRSVMVLFSQRLSFEDSNTSCDVSPHGNLRLMRSFCVTLVSFLAIFFIGICFGANPDLNISRQECAAGRGSSCNELGIAHIEGDVVGQDYIAAINYFEKACDRDIADACLFLGYRVYNGIAVTPDYLAAVKTYLERCELGAGMACNSLGHAFYKGGNVRRNFVKAFGFYEKACQAGVTTACDALGFAYYYGETAEFYEVGCSSGREDACMKMGNAYAMGIGVTQSDSEALKFFAQACDLESEWGCQDYEILKERAEMQRREPSH